MKQNLVVALLFLVMLFASPVCAGFFGISVVENAQKLYGETNYEMAINVINTGLKEGKIDDNEKPIAYELLGQAYKKIGRHSNAKEAFRKALASGAEGYRDNKWILSLDVRQLEKVKELILKASAKNPKAKKSMVADILQLAHNNLASGNLDDATKLFDLAIEIDTAYVKDAFNSIFEKGKEKKGKVSEKYADKALRYASTTEEKERVGKLYLRSAVEIWPDRSYRRLKSKASQFAGHEINKAFSMKPTSIFKKDFTDRDANKRGHIKVFLWATHTKKGDLLKIKAKIKGDENNLDEVGLSLNDTDWLIENGEIKKIIDNSLPYKAYEMCLVAINLGKEIVLTVDIIRDIETPNNVKIDI